ncbi:hypothetical protein TNCV_5059781 [Trichonephila clavipes]|nr:hypothetical protein TNCV_5059781 [Trichonephila clavipes]
MPLSKKRTRVDKPYCTILSLQLPVQDMVGPQLVENGKTLQTANTKERRKTSLQKESLATLGLEIKTHRPRVHGHLATTAIKTLRKDGS